MKANDQQDPLDAPCEMGFKAKMPSGEVHTFRLICQDSHQFLRCTHKLQDRTLIVCAFARSGEIEANETAPHFAEAVIDGARKARLQFIKMKK